MSNFLTVDEFAKEVGVSGATIRAWIRDGDLKPDMVFGNHKVFAGDQIKPAKALLEKKKAAKYEKHRQFAVEMHKKRREELEKLAQQSKKNSENVEKTQKDLKTTSDLEKNRVWIGGNAEILEKMDKLGNAMRVLAVKIDGIEVMVGGIAEINKRMTGLAQALERQGKLIDKVSDDLRTSVVVQDGGIIDPKEGITNKRFKGLENSVRKLSDLVEQLVRQNAVFGPPPKAGNGILGHSPSPPPTTGMYGGGVPGGKS